MNIFDEHPFKVILDYGHNPAAVKAMAQLTEHLDAEGRRSGGARRTGGSARRRRPRDRPPVRRQASTTTSAAATTISRAAAAPRRSRDMLRDGAAPRPASTTAHRGHRRRAGGRAPLRLSQGAPRRSAADLRRRHPAKLEADHPLLARHRGRAGRGAAGNHRRADGVHRPGRALELDEGLSLRARRARRAVGAGGGGLRSGAPSTPAGSPARTSSGIARAR